MWGCSEVAGAVFAVLSVSVMAGCSLAFVAACGMELWYLASSGARPDCSTKERRVLSCLASPRAAECLMAVGWHSPGPAGQHRADVGVGAVGVGGVWVWVVLMGIMLEDGLET